MKHRSRMILALAVGCCASVLSVIISSQHKSLRAAQVSLTTDPVHGVDWGETRYRGKHYIMLRNSHESRSTLTGHEPPPEWAVTLMRKVNPTDNEAMYLIGTGFPFTSSYGIRVLRYGQGAPVQSRYPYKLECFGYSILLPAAWHYKGVLANTAIACVVSFCCVLVFEQMRALSLARRRRLRNGLCHVCSYPVTGLMKCPECGHEMDAL